MNIKSLLPLTVAASLVALPMAAIGDTRAAADGAAPGAPTSYTASVMRLCGEISATGANVQDDACEQDPSTHMADDVERLCNKIDLFNLDIADPACGGEVAGAYVPDGNGGGTNLAKILVPAAAAGGIGVAIAASDGKKKDSGGAI